MDWIPDPASEHSPDRFAGQVIEAPADSADFRLEDDR